jgi:hypothetical protein
MLMTRVIMVPFRPVRCGCLNLILVEIELLATFRLCSSQTGACQCYRTKKCPKPRTAWGGGLSPDSSLSRREHQKLRRLGVDL